MAECYEPVKEEEVKLKDLTHIPKDVRDRVIERDSYEDCPCCVYCGKPKYVQLHHYIERSRGGLGIEENLVCLCAKCHTALHKGDWQIEEYVRMYLSDKYADWDEKKLIAKKG